MAKNRLGQHFLNSIWIARKLVQSCNVNGGDIVVEVGPGKGRVTAELLQRAKLVIAVEKDAHMVVILRKKFADAIMSKKLLLIEGDILDFKPKDFKLSMGSYKLIGSIPYYITAQLFRTFLDCREYPSVIGVIIQREVAKRIAVTKKESLLSLSIKAYGSPQYIQTIKAASFTPKPKVDSAILVIDGISRKFFSDLNEEFFFTVLRCGFSHKRKYVLSNLAIFSIQKNIKDTFLKEGISPRARAEDLSLQDWKKVVKYLS